MLMSVTPLLSGGTDGEPESSWATMSVATAERGRTLIASDIKAFDTQARELVFEMQEAGWIGYVTSRGHAFMLAPDGEATASVSRDSLRGRSGKNARATFERWRREQAEKAKAPGAAFGITGDPADDPDHGAYDVKGMPIASMAEMRRSPQLRAFHDEHGSLEGNALVMHDPDVPRDWAAFDIRRKPPVLIAHGSATTPEESWATALEQDPEMFAPAKQDAVNDGQGADVRMYQCEECGRSFGTPQGLTAHKMSHSGLITCPIEGCGQVVQGLNGLGSHMRKHKPKVEKPTEAVTDGAVTVAPPVGLANSNGGGVTVVSPDVLAEHLLSVPEGSDAEGMVAQIRAVVAAPLVAELQALRAERDVRAEKVAALEHECEELRAKLAIMRDALAL